MADLELTENTNTGTMLPGESAPDTTVEHREPAERNGDDTEARARAMGWSSKEEFRGPADKWVDAAEFVRKGEEDLPVLRERLRDTTRKVAEFERKAKEIEDGYKANVARLERMSDLALMKQRQQLQANYDAALRDAVGMGDTARYDQLVRDKQAAVQEFDTQARSAYNYQPKTEAPQGQAQGGQPEQPQLSEADQSTVKSWVDQNRWFTSDVEMARVAEAHHVRLGREKPGMSLAENLAATRAYVQQRYPERFGTQRDTGAAAVEGGARIASDRAPRGKGSRDLPADARKMGEKWVKEGLFKNLDEYATDYWSQG